MRHSLIRTPRAARFCGARRKHRIPNLIGSCSKTRRNLRADAQVNWSGGNPPGGLTLRKIAAALSEFRYLEDKDRRGPSTGKTSRIAVVSSYDGVEAIFYCYESKWLYTVRH